MPDAVHNRLPLSPEELAVFRGPLVAWYAEHARDLPWRRRWHDPYAVWVSEIMLQQTQVATVVPYYERWMARFPTLRDLAEAPLDEVLQHWAGLGYYARARNLHRAAQIVAERHRGQVPHDPQALQALPGVGRYTAGAILSIAFDRPVPLVDANVARVLCRAFALDGDAKSTPVQRVLWSIADELVGREDAAPAPPSALNQALMELGARICTPADPACERCPLLPACRAGNSPDPTAWPQTAPGRASVRVTHASIVLQDGDRVLVARRPPHGLWGGLWEFPRRACEPGETPAACAARAAREVVGVEAQVGEPVATVKHGVTHHAITLHGFLGRVTGGEVRPRECDAVRWVTLEEASGLALAAPQALLLRRLADDERAPGQARLPL